VVSISFGIGFTALGILALIGCFYLTKLLYRATIKYLPWNINLITKYEGIRMKIKKLVSILVGIALISFGVGLLSLKHFGYKNGIFKFVVDNIAEGIQDDDSNYVEKNIDEEKLENIEGINTIDVDVPFLDVNVIPENRDDVKIHYNGYIKANFIPKLKTERSSSILYISLEKKSHVSYNVKKSNDKTH